MKKYWKSLLIPACVMLAVQLAASPSPWDSWRTAYSCFEQGESFRDKGDYLQALKSFESALANYEAVKKARPDWNQRVIAMRMEKCRTECEKMRRLLGKNAPSVPEPSVSGTDSRVTVRPLPQKSGDSVELRNAKTQLQHAALELRNLRRQQAASKKFEKEIANLMRDLRIAKEENALLARRCKLLEEKTKNPDTGSNVMKKQLLEASLRYERLKKQYDNTVLRMRSVEESMLNQSGLRNAAENAVLKLRSDNEKLLKNIEEYKKSLSEVSGQINILEHDLKEARRQKSELEKKSSKLDSDNKKTADSAALEQIEKYKAELERQNILLRSAVKNQQESEQKFLNANSRLATVESQLSSTVQLLEHERKTSKVTVTELEQLRSIKNSLENELAKVSDALSKSEKRVAERNSKDFIALTKAEERVRLLQQELANAKRETVKFRVSSEESSLANKKLAGESEKLHQELLRVTAERNMLAEQESKQRAKLVTLEEADRELSKMKKNFEALSAENRENRRLVEAAKPREAEFTRIKLRLAELDRLNDSLNREQRLNEELKRTNRQMEKELAETANLRNEFYTARKRLAELEPLQAEVKRLRELNTELAEAKKFEPQVVALKAKIATMEPALKELESIRQLVNKMTIERNELEKEVSRVRNMQTGTQLLESELKALRSKYDKLVTDKNDVDHRFEQLRTRLAALENIDKEYERQKQVNSQLLAMIPPPAEMQALRDSRKKAVELEKRLAAKDEFEKGLTAINANMKEELSKLRLTVAELQAKYGNVVVERNASARGASIESIRVKALELEVNSLKKQIAIISERESVSAGKNKADFDKLQKILSGTSGKAAALESRCVELEAELKKNTEELNDARNDIRRAEQLKLEIDILKKRNLELINENGALYNRVRSADSSVSELARLKSESSNLRQLTRQLEKAKQAESELAALKLKYSEFDQLKDELSRVNRLNRELYARREVLEKELRERPRFGVGGVNAPVVQVKGNPEDFTNSGKIAEAAGNYELARWNYDEALKINSEFPEAMKRAAQLALRSGEFSRSSDLISRMREKDPANQQLAFDLARSYAGEKRFGNALAILESMRSARIKDADFQELISDVYAGSGRFSEAEQCLKMALHLKKDSPEVMIKLAKVILSGSASRTTEAASLYENARALGVQADIDLEPKLGKMIDERRDFELFLFEAAQEAERSREYQSSQWYYRQLIELGRNKDKYVPRMAFVRYMNDDPGAIETLAFNSKTPLGCLVMTLIHLKHKDEKNAIQSAREAKHLNKGKPVAIPDDWHTLAVELKVQLQSAGLGLRGVISENFATK